VKPRGEDYDPEALDTAFAAVLVALRVVEGRCLMQPESGYRTFPYAVSRYDQTPGEVYGRGRRRSCCRRSRRSTREDRVPQAGPPRRRSGAADGRRRLVGMNLRPGAQNKGGVTADGKPLVHTLPTGDIQISEKMMGEERSIIDDVFLVSLFKVLSEHPNMTATQVIELVNEKGMLVAPTLGRQHTEYVGGMVERELDLLADMQMLDPMPPRLREAMGITR
jgi:hypothetical protein